MKPSKIESRLLEMINVGVYQDRFVNLLNAIHKSYAETTNDPVIDDCFFLTALNHICDNLNKAWEA